MWKWKITKGWLKDRWAGYWSQALPVSEGSQSADLVQEGLTQGIESSHKGLIWLWLTDDEPLSNKFSLHLELLCTIGYGKLVQKWLKFFISSCMHALHLGFWSSPHPPWIWVTVVVCYSPENAETGRPASANPMPLQDLSASLCFPGPCLTWQTIWDYSGGAQDASRANPRPSQTSNPQTPC